MRRIVFFILCVEVVFAGLTLDAQSLTRAVDDSQAGTFNIIFKQDLERHRSRNLPAEYTKEIWNPDWNYPGWRDGDNRWPDWFAQNIKDSLVLDPIKRSVAVKYNFTDKIIGDYAGSSSYRGGDYWKVDLGSESKELYLSYNVMLRPGFKFNQGGKLPATNGGTPLKKSTQVDLVRPGYGEGYSSATMFKDYGGLAFYVYYQNQNRDDLGETDYWDTYQPAGLTYDSKGRFIFDTSKKRWYNITLRIVVNTFNGNTPVYNGIMEGFVDGKLVESKTGMFLLTSTDIHKGVNQLAMGVFFGGNSVAARPLRNEWILIDDVVCFTYADGVNITRGNKTSPRGTVLQLPNWKSGQPQDPVTPVDPVDPEDPGNTVDEIPPSTPTGLKATDVGGTFVDLEWNPSEDNVGVFQYNVFQDGAKIGNSNTTSYTVEGLTPDTKYSYKICAADARWNMSPRSSELEVTTTKFDVDPPTVPQNLKMTGKTENSIDITWDASTDNVGVKGYKIFLNGTLSGSPTTNTFTLEGLKADTEYTIYIRAVDNSQNESANSSSIVEKTRVPDTTSPSMPENLRVRTTSRNTIRIAWDQSVDNVALAGYIIYSDGSSVGSTEDEEFTITGLDPETNYFLQVSAIDKSGNESLKSDTLTASTQPPDLIAPTVPKNLRATKTTEKSISIAWDAATDDELEGYAIFLNDDRIDSTSDTKYVITGLQADSEYTASVSAFDNSGNESGRSESLTAKTSSPDHIPPTEPRNLRSIMVTENSITINWVESTDNVGVSSYHVFLNGSKVGETTTNSFIITELVPGISYSIYVVAYDDAENESNPSSQILETTLNGDQTSDVILPEISIIEFEETISPNITAAVTELKSFGHTELVNYGLLVTKFDQHREIEYENWVVYGDQESSEVDHSNRISEGVEVFYDFSKGRGNVVLDRSDSGDPVNLLIDNPIYTSWLPGQGLKVDGNTLITSDTVPSQLMASLKESNEISIEAWIRPTDVNQAGPARIVSLSSGNANRAFTLGQEGNSAVYNFVARLNTSSSSENGLPESSTSEDYFDKDLYHVVYTRGAGGIERIFVNGEQMHTGIRTGDFSSFEDNYLLSIANEISGDKPWKGTYYLLAVYSRELRDNEVKQNFHAGFGDVEFTSNLFVEQNVLYELTPFAKTDQGLVLGAKRELNLESVIPAQRGDSLYMAVFPNPSNGSFTMHIECTQADSDRATIRITDMMGKLMYVESLELGDMCSPVSNQDGYSNEQDLVPSSIEKTFSLSSELDDGIYAVMLIVGNKVVTQRLLIQH